MRAVVEVDRSPVNAARWCLTLECGHEIWVTSQRRPRRKEDFCSKCGELSHSEGKQPE